MPESRTPAETENQPNDAPRSESPPEPAREAPRTPPTADEGSSILDQLRDSFRIRY